jgi:serine/threonine-protein kinase
LKSELVTAPKEEQEKHTANLEAYDLYLKGKYYWNKYSYEGTNKAIECFEKAIKKDPDYALAYATLSSVYVFQSTPLGSIPSKIAMPKAREAANKALELDPNLTEAHVSLGAISTFYDWDGDKAIEYFQRAIELNPNSADVRLWIEFPLSLIKHDFNESISQLNHVLELDPLNLIIRCRLGYVYVYKYEFDRAIEHFQKILEIEPNFVLGHHGLVDVYGQTGRYEEGISKGEQVIKLAGRAQAHLGALAYCYGKSGRKDDARKIINELLDQRKQSYTSPFWIAIIYMGLNEPDHVFEWLEKAYEDRDGNLLYIIAPPFDPIRTEPRFNSLIKKMGLNK